MTADIHTTSIMDIVNYAIGYFALHMPCVAIQGYAIVYDEDGAWCSLCEPEQFEIAMEEQEEKT